MRKLMIFAVLAFATHSWAQSLYDLNVPLITGTLNTGSKSCSYRFVLDALNYKTHTDLRAEGEICDEDFNKSTLRVPSQTEIQITEDIRLSIVQVSTFVYSIYFYDNTGKWIATRQIDITS